MKKLITLLSLIILLVSCSTDEINVTPDLITPVNTTTSAKLKPAITNNVRLLVGKTSKIVSTNLLVKRSTTFVNIIGFTRNELILDTLNTFKNSIPTWRGSNIVDFLYDESQQLISTKTYQGGFLGNNDIPLTTDLTSVVTPIIKNFIYVNGLVQTSDNRYTYDINGNITKFTSNENYIINYEYDNLGRLTKVYIIRNITPQLIGNENQICSSLKTTYDFVYTVYPENNVTNITCEVWSSYYSSLDALDILVNFEHQTLNYTQYISNNLKPGVYASESWYKLFSFDMLSGLLPDNNYTPTLNIVYSNSNGLTTTYDYVYNHDGYLIKYIESINGSSDGLIHTSITLFEY